MRGGSQRSGRNEYGVPGMHNVGEALTGAHAGQLLSSEITSPGVPTLYAEGGGHIRDGVTCEPSRNTTSGIAGTVTNGGSLRDMGTNDLRIDAGGRMNVRIRHPVEKRGEKPHFQ
jgi:hypothetical protein